MRQPLAIDLCCGLGGWTDGLMAQGWRVRGYDIEAHEYGEERYPAELLLRNVLDMHGSEIADADLIVASPPCTEYSYMAMPWGMTKQRHELGCMRGGEYSFSNAFSTGSMDGRVRCGWSPRGGPWIAYAAGYLNGRRKPGLPGW